MMRNCAHRENVERCCVESLHLEILPELKDFFDHFRQPEQQNYH